MTEIINYRLKVKVFALCSRPCLSPLFTVVILVNTKHVKIKNVANFFTKKLKSIEFIMFNPISCFINMRKIKN